MMLWWLSFADDSRPKGSQFLGCAIVEGDDIGLAAINAHALGCNPGGEVVGAPIPEHMAHRIDRKWRDRLLTREETDAFDAEFKQTAD